MFFFEGCSCPVCGQAFKHDDDVVVCPKCGAPHHRECYKTNNVCAFDDKHDEGFIWQKEDYAETQSDSSRNSVRCVFCGTENAPDRLYCSDCNRPLFTSPDYATRANDSSAANENAASASDTSAGHFFVSGSEITIPDGETIDDVPIGDIKKFVQNTFFYYIPTFYIMSRQCKKLTLNFAALFLHGLWFISRKMYILGSFLLTAQLALQFGIAYLNSKYITFIEPAIMQATAENYTTELMKATTDYVTQNPLPAMILIGLTVLSYCLYAFSGLFANHIYKRNCVKRIKEINAAASSVDEFNSALEAQGGISIIATLIFGIIYFVALNYIKKMFMM